MVRKVAVIMGSDSDWPVVKGACAQLKALDIPFEAHILSAHRTPAGAAEFAKSARANGFGVILCAAGMAAHLAGAFAANTTLPVIGIPMKGGAMDGMDALSERLAEADVVASFMPSTPETRGLANAEFFAAMKPGAFFANGGRGDLVVADDLVAALESGQLAGAAVDVTDPEPLPATSPLWDAPNMFITPHVSGWFHLEATLNNVVDIAAENLRHLQAGETLRCWIEH